MTLGVERALSAHCELDAGPQPLPWLQDAVALVATPGDQSSATPNPSRPANVRAIVLFGHE